MKTKILTLIIATLTTCLYAQTPIAQYNFNGDANDITGNGNHGTVNGATLTTDRFGNPNSAYSFDGMNNWITTPHVSGINDGEFSVSLWFYKINEIGDTPGRTNMEILIRKNNDVAGGSKLNAFQLRLADTIPATNTPTQEPFMLVSDVSNSTNTSNLKLMPSIMSIYTNQWYNVVVTYNATTKKLYLDGILVADSTYLENFHVNTDNFTLGRYWQAGVPERFFEGKLDNFTIYDYTLDATQVDSIYQAEVLGLASPNDLNTLRVYPNPASDHITIDNGDYTTMINYTIKIVNDLGQEIFNNIVNTQQFQIPVSTFGAEGLYYIQIFDDNNTLLETKKLILN